jgi:aminocarboxymuconate-semialdehyde decarboxylase
MTGVIDSQTHWYPRLLWEAYAGREEYPRARRDGDGYLFELAPDRWLPIRPEFYELDLQLEAFAAAGVDAVVSSSASFGEVDALPVEQATEVAIALNEARADAEREHAGRFYGLATLPWQSAEAALAVLDDAAGRLRLHGVLLHSNVAGVPVDAEHLRPVYRRIAELGLPLCLHPVRTPMEEQLRDHGLEFLLGFMFDTSIAALRLVLSGILLELPDLKVVHPHCGATLPYLAGRIDGSYVKPYSLGAPMEVPPSAQLARMYTDTMSQSVETLAFARRFYGDERVLWGSDFPYFEPQAEHDLVSQAVEDDPARAAILGANAATLFGI